MSDEFRIEIGEGLLNVAELGWTHLGLAAKDELCTYTRELTVDLPDVDKVDLSEQGDEEYCENCGRPMVLKLGRFGTFYACTGYPGLARPPSPSAGSRKNRT